MIQPVEPESKDQLESEYDLRTRAAIRVAALWQKGLGASEAFLDQVEHGNAYEQLLLSGPLMDEAEDLTGERLKEISNQVLVDDQMPAQEIVLDTEGSVPTLCLREERLAAETWTKEDPDATGKESDDGPGTEEPSSTTDETTILPSQSSDQEPVLDTDETDALFSDKDVQELKLAVLTGVDPEKKIEALRKLTLAPIDEQTQGLVFLNALTDDAPEVREQAAQSLEKLGLTEPLSDAIQTFLSGDREQKRYACEKIRSLLDEASNLEKAITIALFTSELQSETDPEVLEMIIETLTVHSTFIAENAGDHLAELTRHTIESLVSHFQDINEPVRGLYQELGSAMPDRVYDILWEEASSIEERELRAYLLILLGELPLDEERTTKISHEMVRTIRGWSDTEIECRRLGNALTQQGEPAIQEIIDQLSSAETQQQVYLLRLLDELLIDHEPSPELRNALESFLIDVTEIEDRRIREPLMDLHLLYHVSLTEDTKRSLARLLMEPLQRFKNDRIGKMTPVILEKMGSDIFSVLLEYLQDGTYPIQREVALEVLGNKFPEVNVDVLDEGDRSRLQEQLREFDEHLEERINDTSDEVQSNIIVNQAKALASPISDRERALEKMEDLRERIEYQHTPHAALKGLGWLASSPLVEPETAMETGVSFLEYLDSELPEDISEEVETENGRTLLVDRKTEIYTRLIPSVIDGLTRICQRETLTDSFRERICNRLLEKWYELVDFETVWAPGSVTQLAEDLGKICMSPHIDIGIKEDLLKGLSRRVNNLTVIDIIGDVLSSDLESERIRELCRKITEALLEMLEMPDYQDPEDRRIILDNLGQICSRRNLAGDRRENKHLRIKVIDALFDGLYDQIDGVHQTLEDLADHDRVPKKYQEKIKKQLAKYRETN